MLDSSLDCSVKGDTALETRLTGFSSEEAPRLFSRHRIIVMEPANTSCYAFHSGTGAGN